jgi:hypothetical protein
MAFRARALCWSGRDCDFDPLPASGNVEQHDHPTVSVGVAERLAVKLDVDAILKIGSPIPCSNLERSKPFSGMATLPCP